MTFILHINKPEFSCFNARALLQGSLVFLLTCLIFRQKSSLWLLAQAPFWHNLVLRGGSEASTFPEARCWCLWRGFEHIYLYSSLKRFGAALPFGSLCAGSVVSVYFCLPQICNSFVKRIVLKWTQLLLLGDRSRRGPFVGKGRTAKAVFSQQFWRNPGTGPVLLHKISVWGSGNYLSHLTKWHSHMCGRA